MSMWFYLLELGLFKHLYSAVGQVNKFLILAKLTCMSWNWVAVNWFRMVLVTMTEAIWLC